MARITCHGVRAEFQIPRSVPPAKWNVAKERMDGNNATANEVNRYLDEVRASLLGLQREMEADGKDITAHIIKERYIGSSESLPTILELFNENNSYMAAQCGKEFSQKTIDRYSTTYRHLREFIKRRHNRADICVSEVSYDFIDSYEKWLKTNKECNHNSALKHIKALKKVVRAAFLKGIIKKNPFENYKLRELPVERDYLTEHELGAILNKDMKIQRLERVKDIFLFCCYTGLSYCDAQAVSVSNIVIEDGEPEIHIPRQKTKNLCKIPLLPEAIRLINKYASNEYCQETGRLLPVPSNQKLNSYLTEIADLCGITKKLTMHIARHTFSTTVTLANGVPIETISKIIGHRNLRTTMIYAKITDNKVRKDMGALKEKMLKESEMQEQLIVLNTRQRMCI